MKRLAIFALVAMMSVPVCASITTKNMETVTPQQLGELLAGPGIQITNVTINGSPAAAGTFTGGLAAGLGIEDGVILSSGAIENIIGPNDSPGKTSSLSTPGDPDLNALVAPLTTNDAMVLEFDFVAESSNFAIRYVFGSEEYKEYVGSAFNDVFGFFLDGANIAYVAGSASELVSINSINHEKNSSYYIDNPPGPGAFNTQLDGFTTILFAVATVTPGTSHHIKLAIADTSDSVLDSVVVLQAGGITGSPMRSLIATPRQSFVWDGNEVEFDVDAYGLPADVPFHVAAENLPNGASISFDPAVIERAIGGTTRTRATLIFAPGTFPRDYAIDLRADAEGYPTVRGSALITLGCTPPIILAIDQPASRTMLPGTTATIEVNPSGSGPFNYQWYEGPRGSIFFPVAGGTTNRLTTPPIEHLRSFWVRVENACGSTDSAAARLSTKSSRTGRPVGP
ncbi:MAG: choice-of-anchor L domain-containing protein [Thermoanaerobaculia bacterium]